jgi:hypothetical protein
MLIRRDQKSGSATSGIKHSIGFLRVNDFDNKVYDVTRGAELSGVTL